MTVIDRDAHRVPTRRGGRSAFTLVELVTAAALMTIMMLGVVQIFGMITQTAGETEGYQFAAQQQRAILDTIHRDVAGMTRDGYIRISAAALTSTAGYGNDTLALTTVGSLTGSWSSASAAAYETVYTTHVFTPYAMLILNSSSADSSHPLMDQRCGLLGRGTWLFSGTGGNSFGYPPDEYYSHGDVSKKPTLAELAADPTNSMYPLDYLKVWPVASDGGYPASANAPSLRRVMASRCSEFYVEGLYFSANSDPTKSDYKWSHLSATSYPGLNKTGSGYCPRAIRVTLSIHSPDDRAPVPTASGRFRGHAMQEVYWIGDP
jgi:hypothetical protein